MRQLTYAQAIREGTLQCMEEDENVILIGEGVPDGVFGTTEKLQAWFPDRVFDSPLSENAVTGACIGAAINGKRPIMVHQRADFSLLALDQIINNAAKWRVMFGGVSSVPMVIRMVVGRGWGQGPQHSQSFHNLFAAIPGLKVVMPTTPYDAKGIMVAAIRSDDPVIILEHRWLYNIADDVPQEIYEVPLDEAALLRYGNDVTVVGFSYTTIEALKAHEFLTKNYGISIEVIDTVSAAPLDIAGIVNSVKHTGRLIVADISHTTGSIGGEIVRQVVEEAFHYLKCAPIVLGSEDRPQSTSHLTNKDFYTDTYDIVNTCLAFMGKDEITKVYPEYHDIPDKSFVGPF